VKNAVVGSALLLLGCQAPPGSAGEPRARVYVFIASDCPLSNSYAPEIRRTIQEYSPRGVRFTLVYVDPDLTLDQVRRHARDYGYDAPIFLDLSREWVERLGVHVTPEVAVLTPDGAIAYRGRIDDRAMELGKTRPEPTQRDLRLALEDVLQGRPVQVPSAPAVGCFIPSRR
jgi:hypothetical protein